MKHLLLFVCLLSQCCFSQSQKSKLKPFLKEIVTQFPNVRDIAIAPDGNEIMFTAQSTMGNLSTIITIKKEASGWTKPQVSSFSGQHFDLEPFFSLDGLKLYFVSTRPLNPMDSKAKDFDIWYVERRSLQSLWSEAKNMGSPINTSYDEFYPSIATNGNFYFTRDNPDLKRKDDIYVSLYNAGDYEEPIALSDAINTDSYEYNAFIAPDESYLIFGAYARDDGLGSGDLYISYRTETGWTTARNLSTINSDKMDYCPFVDTKSKTLYFTSKLDHTEIQHSTPLTIQGLMQEFKRYDNGLSRLYQIPFDADVYKN